MVSCLVAASVEAQTMAKRDEPVYGFIKPANDAHTLGVNSITSLLSDCGFKVMVADDNVEQAASNYVSKVRRKVIIDWLREHHITRVGISYRLDTDDAVDLIGHVVHEMKEQRLFSFQEGPVDMILFAGLPDACAAIQDEFKGLVKTFKGGESVKETLQLLGIPVESMPNEIIEGNKYDDALLSFGKQIIDKQEYKHFLPAKKKSYVELGTSKDTLVKRINNNVRYSSEPLVRAHVGPYSAKQSRTEAVDEFLIWVKKLARSKLLDILSIGTSQLTQANFGENWHDKPNGGGVPINSSEEYRKVWEAARPLLVRTYAGTNNILKLAKMYEETLHTCWHALSLWWFNRLDERGPLDLYSNLQEHIETIRYLGRIGSPFEANVPHHFAFRGADDVTYIVSEYLAAKLAKLSGIRIFVLQNMLNTPRTTWGIQDLAKSRAMLKLLKRLEDESFRIILQPRAGLDYFKADQYEAKIQLAAVSALMDDIDPQNDLSPPVIHVVSYSEGSHLATPDVIDESIQITQHALREYRALRKRGSVNNMSDHDEINVRQRELYDAAVQIIMAIEKNIENPYSAEGFYQVFSAGFLPVPYLWKEVDEFRHAKNWQTRPIKGSVKLVDNDGKQMDLAKRISIAMCNLKDARHNLNFRTTYKPNDARPRFLINESLP